MPTKTKLKRRIVNVLSFTIPVNILFIIVFLHILNVFTINLSCIIKIRSNLYYLLINRFFFSIPLNILFVLWKSDCSDCLFFFLLVFAMLFGHCWHWILIDRHSNATEEEKKEQERKFKELGEAYGILSDSKKKSRYDNGHDLEEVETGNYSGN